jgi:hypothetical protein
MRRVCPHTTAAIGAGNRDGHRRGQQALAPPRASSGYPEHPLARRLNLNRDMTRPTLACLPLLVLLGCAAEPADDADTDPTIDGRADDLHGRRVTIEVTSRRELRGFEHAVPIGTELLADGSLHVQGPWFTIKGEWLRARDQPWPWKFSVGTVSETAQFTPSFLLYYRAPGATEFEPLTVICPDGEPHSFFRSLLIDPARHEIEYAALAMSTLAGWTGTAAEVQNEQVWDAAHPDAEYGLFVVPYADLRGFEDREVDISASPANLASN